MDLLLITRSCGIYLHEFVVDNKFLADVCDGKASFRDSAHWNDLQCLTAERQRITDVEQRLDVVDTAVAAMKAWGTRMDEIDAELSTLNLNLKTYNQ